MNNNKKKITTIVLLFAFLAIAVTGGTLAYFTDTKDATNTFVMGNVEIALTESAWVSATNVYPGQVLAKNPVVENTGNNPCYVRIQVTGLDQFTTAYPGSLITYRTTGGNVGDLGDKWELSGDYFYYLEPLAVGDSTDALFDEIIIPTALKNGTTATDILVKAQAIQSKSFVDGGGKTAMEKAWEAFEAQMTP